MNKKNVLNAMQYTIHRVFFGKFLFWMNLDTHIDFVQVHEFVFVYCFNETYFRLPLLRIYCRAYYCDRQRHQKKINIFSHILIEILQQCFMRAFIFHDIIIWQAHTCEYIKDMVIDTAMIHLMMLPLLLSFFSLPIHCCWQKWYDYNSLVMGPMWNEKNK